MHVYPAQHKIITSGIRSCNPSKRVAANVRPPHCRAFLHNVRVTAVRTAGQSRSRFILSHFIQMLKYAPQFSKICLKKELQCRQYSLLGPQLYLTLQQYCCDVTTYGLVFYVIFLLISSSNTRTLVPSLRLQSF